MQRLASAFPRLTGLDGVPDDIAWRLVESVFGQLRALIVGALCCAMVGVAGYVGNGTGWYLVGLVYTGLVTCWRFAQIRRFNRTRHRATPSVWALRNLVSSSAMALGWAGWTLAVPFETQKDMVALVLGIHAGLVAGAAVRNNAVRVITTAQTLIASPPMLVACLAADSPYLQLYALVVPIQIFGSLGLARFLHEQTVRTLTSEKEARALAGKLAAANDELALVNEHLQELVGLDPLTGLPNRRAFDLAAARAWRSASREGTPLAVMMVDVDHFKLFNDHYGHLAGDECLRRVAATVAGVLRRPGDLLARYGGEEFIAVVPSTDAAGAVAMAERMLADLAECAFTHAPAPLGRISASIGVASVASVQGHTLTELVAHADRALYAAKRAGRNRALVYATEMLPGALSDA